MAKRKYIKKSDYWIKSKQSDGKREVFPDINYKFDDSDHFTAIAACGGGSNISYRDNFGQSIIPVNAYSNIDSGLLPYEASNGYINIKRIINLCMKAYANVSIVRNTIESAVEFSSAPLHVKSSNQTVKDFITEWLNRINISSLSNQFFREYYRGGNVFLYKFLGEMEASQFGKMKSLFGAKNDSIPIRYIILNPAQIYLEGGIGYNSNNWAKILSNYEVERLKEPKTSEDKQILNSLPLNIREQIKAGNTNTIYMPLQLSRLCSVFYKKQAYEPFSVPMIYPVLNDIEWKLELKKMDMSLSRTIENVILLITHGQKNDEHNKAGVNPQNLVNLQNIFNNRAIGRTLVADYTTKGEWLIPDIAGILGPEKYKQVESDIKEGLQSIFGGSDEKFANAQIKAKIFIERMKEGQRAFLNDFLIPEIKQVCEAMGFRNVPVIEFENIDLSDSSVMARVYMQMAQLGLLTAEEVFTAVKSGVLPDIDTSLVSQKKYKDERDQGYYAPLIGGEKQENGRPDGTSSPQTTKKVSPIGQKGAREDKFNSTKIAEISIKADSVYDNVVARLKKKFKIGEDQVLDEAQSYIAKSIAKRVISNESPDKWDTKVLKSYIENPPEIKKEIAAEIDTISLKYDVDSWQAAILRHSKV